MSTTTWAYISYFYCAVLVLLLAVLIPAFKFMITGLHLYSKENFNWRYKQGPLFQLGPFCCFESGLLLPIPFSFRFFFACCVRARR